MQNKHILKSSDFQIFKCALVYLKFVSRSVVGGHQLKQITLNFKTSCCNLKIRGLGRKECVAFLLFYFLKGIMTF